jgi:rod shape-determining protein MreB
MQNFFSKFLSNDIGIDLGTANTLVYMPGQGIIINEPSVVAVNQKTGQVVAVGVEAKRMLGRTPSHITAIEPLVDGVISDFEVTEEMLSYLINKAQQGSNKLFGPRVVIGVPSDTTNVQRRAVRDVAESAGAREVHLVEEALSAAIGIRLPIHEASGNMIVDIGGGTTDIAIMSLSGIVHSKNLKVAGNRFNDDIVSYVRNEFKILIGEKTAENLKIAVGSVAEPDDATEVTIRGRDLVSGLPREVVITGRDVRDAIGHSVETLIESIKEVLEDTPPEIVSDIMQNGIHLTGGGALLRGLAEVLSDYLKVPVHIADDPLTCVVRGTGLIIEDFETYKDILIYEAHELPPKV